MAPITRIRTIRIAERANLVWVELETADGVTGLGESFRGAHAVEAAVHDLFGPWLLGRDSEDIALIHNHLTRPVVGFNSSGAEMRAASAIDIALWDIKGKRYGVPVYAAMGGACRKEIRAYNTCAGYSYNAQGDRRQITGNDRVSGPYDDQIAFTRDAGELARSLLDEGYTAMKIWPFDIYAAAPASHSIALADLRAGLEPFAKIRKAVGDKIDVMCELHSLWGATAASRICAALSEYDVFWAEDCVCKNDDAKALADIRRRTGVPVCASETLGGSLPFRDLLAADAVDYVMLDLAWCGGISQGLKIAALADAYARPVAPHDCTGPVVLMAGVHLAMHASNAIFQEVVRAYLSSWYKDLVTALPEVRNGMVLAPTEPGLGTALAPDVVKRADAVVRETERS